MTTIFYSLRRAIGVALTVSVLLVAGGVRAQSDLPPAPIVNDEGGTVLITGTMVYTDPLFTAGVAQPVIILEDQAGFVDRNRGYLMPVESQVLGQIITDFYVSPVSYSMTLPIEPRGGFRDVDGDDNDDIGVQIFATAYWNNTFGDPFLEERDLYGGGWSGAYASTRISEDPALEWEVIGGTLIVWAPDDQQGFPIGFGDDGLLFTEDDPRVRLPAGWTVVNIDSEPFTFDRSREVVIDLIEPEGAALVDFSELGFAEGFDAIIEEMRTRYAFTEYKNIDWDALHEEFRPRFERADRQGAPLIYALALRDFAWRIPDGHVGWGARFILDFIAQEEIGGGLGMAIRELDDGRIIVNYLTPGGAAESAGIDLRDTIVSINGRPIADVVSANVPWTSSFSTDHVRRLEQLRYAIRFPVNTRVEVTYLPTAGGDPVTVSLTAVAETDSLDYAERAVRASRTGFELPVEYEVLDSGYVVVRITDFLDNSLLTIQLWERLMQNLNSTGVPGLIIDMRENGGGSGFLSTQMSAYFFDEPLVVGRRYVYDKVSGEFYTDSRTDPVFYLPSENLRYRGEVAVLVGPNCNSACEFFSYNMTLQDRAAIVGQYPTAGLGGGISYFLAPLGIFFQYTASRAVDLDDNIHIEGIGVVPTITVPVTEETLFSTGDPVLEAAIAHLDSVIGDR